MRKAVLTHIVHEEDGTVSGVWGPFTLRTAFQPIFAFHHGKLPIAAFEGLIRPFRGDEEIPATSFFAALTAIDKLFVETLTRTLHLLNAGACLPKEASIFVNFDPSLFVERAVVDSAIADMRLTLNSAGIDAQRIVCEVTEQKATTPDALSDFTRALRQNGFRLAVDDYGAADSDVDRVRELQPQIVKFDAQWISRLMVSGPGFGLLSAMVDIFAGQGIETVFEGIEETWQLDLAEKCGASMVQGFVLARPELVPTSFANFPTLKGIQPIAARKEIPSDVKPVPVGVASHAGRTFGRRVAR